MFVFGIYLIVDTQLIMGGKQVELAIDEYILAAMMLYIDIIQIFLYILRLLGDRRWPIMILDTLNMTLYFEYKDNFDYNDHQNHNKTAQPFKKISRCLLVC